MKFQILHRFTVCAGVLLLGGLVIAGVPEG